MEPLEVVLAAASADLDALDVRWAIIGGLAVAYRSEPRFTKDVDFAVAVDDDRQAEALVNGLQSRGYSIVMMVEQEYLNRLGTVRLASPVVGVAAYVDLLFASSGIEAEIVARADRLEIPPDLSLPVASRGHLIALKVLAGRNQDLTDLGRLISVADAADLDEARAAVELIMDRGFNRGQPLRDDLSALIEDLRTPGNQG